MTSSGKSFRLLMQAQGWMPRETALVAAPAPRADRSRSRTRRMHAAVIVAGVTAAGLPVAAQRAPAPAASHVPAEVLALACAPRAAFQPSTVPLRITGGQDAVSRHNFAPGDLVTINAGSQNGIGVGQEFFVRRTQSTPGTAVTRETPGTIRTTGWIRVYAVDDEMSLATVTHACETIDVGDYLEPFALPQVPPIATDRPKAQRDNYGRVMKGSDGRFTFGKGDYFVVNRGSEHGVTPGARLVLYRDRQQPDNFLFELGEAVAVDVAAETSTVLVITSLDGIIEGDYVALRKAAGESK